MTGANSGLGLITALELARHGAQVIVACRSGREGRGRCPDGPGEMRGSPKRVRATSDAYDLEIGRRLWEASEELTGVSYLP